MVNRKIGANIHGSGGETPTQITGGLGAQYDAVDQAQTAIVDKMMHKADPSGIMVATDPESIRYFHLQNGQTLSNGSNTLSFIQAHYLSVYPDRTAPKTAQDVVSALRDPKVFNELYKATQRDVSDNSAAEVKANQRYNDEVRSKGLNTTGRSLLGYHWQETLSAAEVLEAKRTGGVVVDPRAVAPAQGIRNTEGDEYALNCRARDLEDFAKLESQRFALGQKMFPQQAAVNAPALQPSTKP